MNCTAPSLLQRWLILLMAGLLTLGPFLHSHFGTSHDTGFHLDGVRTLPIRALTDVTVMQASEEESPALGVAASLPQPGDEERDLIGLTLLMAILPLLTQRRLLLSLMPGRSTPSCGLYLAGMPPPSLAPPTV